MKTFFMIIRDGDQWSIKTDMHAGTAIAEAVERFAHTRAREPIHGSRGLLGWIIGTDTTEAPAVYVVQENEGEKVTATSASRASIDVLVNILRGHGYTCIKRGGA